MPRYYSRIQGKKMYFKNYIDNEEIIMHMYIYLSTGMFIPELFVVENL